MPTKILSLNIFFLFSFFFSIINFKIKCTTQMQSAKKKVAIQNFHICYLLFYYIINNEIISLLNDKFLYSQINSRITGRLDGIQIKADLLHFVSESSIHNKWNIITDCQSFILRHFIFIKRNA